MKSLISFIIFLLAINVCSGNAIKNLPSALFVHQSAANNPIAISNGFIFSIDLKDTSAKKSKAFNASNKKSKIDSAVDSTQEAATDPPPDSTFHSGITFLNAFNFDFSNNFSTSYLGLFNIFAPYAFKDPRKHRKHNWFNSRFGLDAGFEKIDYTTGNINGNDSTQSYYFHQNVLADPLDLYRAPNSANDTIRAGASYSRQLNKYTFSSSNVVFSAYFQFLWNTNALKDSLDRKVGIYLTLHTEFLVNQFSKTANIQNIAQDSQQVQSDQTHQTAGFVYSQANQIVSNYNFISPYFGLGFTAYIKPFPKRKNTHIFGNLIFGAVKNTPNFNNLFNDSIAPPALNGTYPLSTSYSQWKGFYLVKVAFIEKITNNSDLIIGYNLRGIFKPIKYPQYAAYVGINLGLDPIINAITGAGKTGDSSSQ